MTTRREYRAGGRWVDTPEDGRLKWLEGYSADRRSLLARLADHVKELWRVLFSDNDLS